jgi:spoIIIJ-associated protein
VSESVRVEATGESLAEAKWNALRELEALTPSLESSTVVFEVLSEGRRGLLGVGYEPVRVAASAPAATAPAATAPAAPPARPLPGESEAASRLRALLERVAAALAIEADVEIAEDEEGITGTYTGDDLGRLIGRRGQTLDALQLLAGAILQRGEVERRAVTVDAAGYRGRRRRWLEGLAERSAGEALSRGARVALEPMSASERKLVHNALEGHAGVRTSSEGVEPNRYVVVEPA